MDHRASSAVDLWIAQQRLRLSLDAARWRRVSARFPEILASMRGLEVTPWVTPLWEAFNERMQAAVLPRPPKRFLRESVIRRSMFVDVRGAWLDSQLGQVRQHFGNRLSELARESPVGDPPLCDAGLMTSHNSVHHLSHLARYERRTRKRLEEYERVLEWGGGYGNLARIMLALRGKQARYVIVDTPLFCAIQWLYLSTVLGEDEVTLWLGEGTFPSSRVVLVPVPLVERLQYDPELFISTWALSECSTHAQDFVAMQKQWFGAGQLLLGFQESNQDLPDAGRIEQFAREAGCTIEPVGVIEANHYAFR